MKRNPLRNAKVIYHCLAWQPDGWALYYMPDRTLAVISGPATNPKIAAVDFREAVQRIVMTAGDCVAKVRGCQRLIELTHGQ